MVVQVLQGTCGWSDESLVRCNKLYPASVRSAEDRLRTYSCHFPCVEVDSSCYAIPSPATTQRWAKQTPPGFLFHFKAFGAFCSGGCPVGALPRSVRDMLPPQHVAAAAAASAAGSGGSGGGAHVSLAALPPAALDHLWERFHSALAPVAAARRMGMVVCQFHLGFGPSVANRAWVLDVRRRLDARHTLAVEFRHRGWFKDPDALEALAGWLSAEGIVLIAADELAHETAQRDRAQTGLPPGAVARVLPIALAATNPHAGLYVRLHRRHGTAERVLPAQEIQAWAQRLVDIAPRLQGPIHFLWGTDWQDAPLRNAAALTAALPQQLASNWAATLRSTAGRGSICAYLQPAAAPLGAVAAAAAAAAAATAAEGAGVGGQRQRDTSDDEGGDRAVLAASRAEDGGEGHATAEQAPRAAASAVAPDGTGVARPATAGSAESCGGSLPTVDTLDVGSDAGQPKALGAHQALVLNAAHRSGAAAPSSRVGALGGTDPIRQPQQRQQQRKQQRHPAKVQQPADKRQRSIAGFLTPAVSGKQPGDQQVEPG